MRLAKNWPGALLVAAVALASSACVQLGDPEIKTFDKTYTVKGPVTLEIQNGSGDVKVTGSSSGQVHVRGEVRVHEFIFASGTRRRVDEIVEKPPITQVGDILRITRPQTNGPGGARISYVIEVPSNSEVRVENGSGDVAVQDVQGPLNLETGSGDMQVSRIQQRADLKAGSGDITVHSAKGQVVVTARSGELVLEDVGGDIRAQTGSGDIRINRPGGKVEARANSGDVAIDGVSADLRISTGSGSCHVTGNPAPSSQWQIETRSGEAILDVPERASFQINARSRDRVDSDIAMTIESQTRKELRGRVGKGEARVSIETGSGRIRIR
ncbi:MAG: DUF4097 family beta strand repeat protein [Acidobacteria bacterium]|nr:DUF4097 family beta strand repeat protein [Acidobacteriota bacterium]